MLINPLNPKACEIHTFFDVYRTINRIDPGYSYDTSPYRSRIDFIFANSFFTGKFMNTTVGDTESASSASDHYAVDAFLHLNPGITTSSTTTTTTTSASSQSTSLYILFQISATFVIVLRKKQ